GGLSLPRDPVKPAYLTKGSPARTGARNAIPSTEAVTGGPSACHPAAAAAASSISFITTPPWMVPYRLVSCSLMMCASVTRDAAGCFVSVGRVACRSATSTLLRESGQGRNRMRVRVRGQVAGLRTRGHVSSYDTPAGRRSPGPVRRTQCVYGGRFRSPLRGSPGVPPGCLSRRPAVGPHAFRAVGEGGANQLRARSYGPRLVVRGLGPPSVRCHRAQEADVRPVARAGAGDLGAYAVHVGDQGLGQC